MPNKPTTEDDRVRNLEPHLSALVDGELTPLEAIAIHRQMRDSALLGETVRDLEQLKLAVHLSGIQRAVPEGVEHRLRRSIALTAAGYARKQRQRRTWRAATGGGVVAALAAAALAMFILSEPAAVETGDAPGVASAARADSATPTSPAPSTPNAPMVLNDTSLALLAAVHRGDRGADALKTLSAQKVLLELETLPESFIADGGERSRIVQASYLLCDEPASTATLAILDARKVELPSSVAGVLEASRTYFEVVDGTEMRLSIAGDKLFVLMNDVKSAVSIEPI